MVVGAHVARFRFQLTQGAINKSLDCLAQRDVHIAHWLNHVGYPEARRRDQGFAALAQIIVGQQVSTHAARAITARLVAELGGEVTPQAVQQKDDDRLRSVGLSRQKVTYLRSLTEAVLAGALPVDKLHTLTDSEAIDRITAVKGFGEWSAHMYLMFALGRPDVWPVGDLAVRAGFGQIMALDERPTPAQTLALATPFAPHRSALALLCWKVYSEAPLS
jgi:DNA-3-methyladenine glycosylase II